MTKIEQKLEQRECFIDDVYTILLNSNSKSATITSLLLIFKRQTEAQKLGVI